MSKIPKMTPEEFCDIRETLKSTQDKMGDLMGVDTRTIRRWEKGERSIPGPAVLLAKILVDNYRKSNHALFGA
jgi:DNA-binding transcriptional regulator YiaG